MFSRIITSVFILASFTSAHFSIEYPEMRGDSFAAGASQYIYPYPTSELISLGANVNQTAATNRTVWPLTGGSLNLDLHHPWSYIFINLGLGTDYPIFNISLTGQFLNETGNGTLCLPQLALPAEISPSDGSNASIQVVTLGQTGSALYNKKRNSKLIREQCADITFRTSATILSGDKCSNSSNVAVSVVAQEVNGSTTSSAANSTSTKTSTGSILTSHSAVAATFVSCLGALAIGWLL
ncbi:hypothetical protein LSUE1_G005642 [Lachnellula suecica]|uniref:Copper acquisition factor BIM1-like domain-containing protein n=1 Tax=Lachnellula suecica TaxID=602035 RepID=A0A8T9C476_9HELO|nr:hypothetical protein LSUE1_G005642 [Lachnellula suecica]